MNNLNIDPIIIILCNIMHTVIVPLNDDDVNAMCDTMWMTCQMFVEYIQIFHHRPNIHKVSQMFPKSTKCWPNLPNIRRIFQLLCRVCLTFAKSMSCTCKVSQIYDKFANYSGESVKQQQNLQNSCRVSLLIHKVCQLLHIVCKIYAKSIKYVQNLLYGNLIAWLMFFTSLTIYPSLLPTLSSSLVNVFQPMGTQLLKLFLFFSQNLEVNLIILVPHWNNPHRLMWQQINRFVIRQ